MILHTRSFTKRGLRSFTVWSIAGLAAISAGPAVGLAGQQTEPQPRGARRTITNKDLEKFRVARVRSEAQYERRCRELGLPTVEEHRLRTFAQVTSDSEFTSNMRARESESERYWRSRASELRSELVATNARIDFVRARLNELPTGSSFSSVATLPYSPFGQPFGNNLARGFYGNRSSRWFRQNSGRVTFGQSYFGGMMPAQSYFPFMPSYGNPYEDSSYERSMLTTQLDELLGHRAGLQARWRDLEEEARRAGAYPGWLRP
jgi:hypothetical protein